MFRSLLALIFAISHVFNVNYLHCHHQHGHQATHIEKSEHQGEHEEHHDENPEKPKSNHSLSCLKDSKRNDEEFQVLIAAPDIKDQFKYFTSILYEIRSVSIIENISFTKIFLRQPLLRGPPLKTLKIS